MSRALCLIYFFLVRPLTPRCDIELEREASRVAEASQVEVQRWKEKAEGESHRPAPLFGLFPFALNPQPACLGAGLEKEASQAAEASIAVQAVLEAKIREHNVLQSTACTACEALEVGGVESGRFLRSRLISLSSRVHEWLRGALHMGVKRALAVVSSHYAGIDLEAISDGYVMAEDDEKVEEEVMKLEEAAEAPGTALASLFEEEVVPPMPTADAGNPGF